MNIKQFRSVIASFYHQAVKDVWIGYHFSHIADLTPHIDHIARFWYFQYHQKKVNGFDDEQFNLIQAHLPLKATLGQLNRWIVLFEQSLQQAEQDNIIGHEDKKWWIDSILRFKEIFIKNEALLR
jgi:hypothetical protein